MFGSSSLNDWIQNPIIKANNLPEAVTTILNVAFALAGVIAVVFLIVGGFRYITAGGNAEQSEQAKTTILNAVIGLVVILIAYLVVKYVLDALGFSSQAI